MPTLKLSNNSIQNPLTVDLSQYLKLNEGAGVDPYDPAFREALISHSLLKEGGVLALENLQAKELIFPVGLQAATSSAVATLIQQINQVITSPGATVSWQDDGMSQATTFDLISGQLDIQYSYRRAQIHWTDAKLRLFTQPLGRTAAPRAYAAASGLGPLLMITPYGSDGSLQIGASTQAGVAGFGGKPWGGSSGVFYAGNPSLAGDISAQMVMTFTPTGSINSSPSIAAVSLLPDGTYWPAPRLNGLGGSSYSASSYFGKVYQYFGGGSTSAFVSFQPIGTGSMVPLSWQGNHRLLALARGSNTGLPGVGVGSLFTVTSPLVPYSTVASVVAGSAWSLYDLGVVALRPSSVVAQQVTIGAQIPSVLGASFSIDVSAVFMVPDSSTWFAGGAAMSANIPPNLIVINDQLGEQYGNSAAQPTAPSPTSSLYDQTLRLTPFTRGLVPRPDPKNGMPVLAVIGVGGGVAYPFPLLSAQVQMLERTRYVFG